MQEVFPGLVPNLIFTGQRIESPSKGAKTVRNAVTYAARQERRSQLNLVKTSVGLLAQEAPRELYELHAEIERVTLAKMIERYQQMLGEELPESHWQRFFEDNMFILSMVFARPVSLLHTQFHARGSMIHGAGAHIGDLLFAQGRELAIVEIKKPSTPLMQSSHTATRTFTGHICSSAAPSLRCCINRASCARIGCHTFKIGPCAICIQTPPGAS